MELRGVPQKPSPLGGRWPRPRPRPDEGRACRYCPLTDSWFVGNGLDRSVLPCQKHDATGKPRAIRRDFMRCARPDVRMGQDPSLQISRKRTPSTRCTSPFRGGVASGFPHFNKPCLSCYFAGLHGVFHSFNMVFHISTVERCRKPVQNVEKARRSPPRRDFLRFVQSCFTRCSFFGSML